MKRSLFSIITLFFITLFVAAQPRISSNKETHNFGQIEWKHPVSVEYIITNTGDKPLVLTNVTTSCACSVADWTKTPIAPGDKGFVTATFDAEALGHFEKTVGIYSNAQPSLVYLKFTGEVVREVTDYTKTHPYTIGSIRLDRNEFDFPDAHRGEKPTITFSVVNLSGSPYEPVLMHLPPYLKMEKSPEVLLKGKKGTIKLTLDTEQLTDLGLTQTSVYLARFSGDKVGEENEIPVSAILLPDFTGMSEQDRLNAPSISLSETNIDLSARLAKKNKASHDIVITNTGKSPLQINKLQVFNSSVGVSLKKALLQPGESTKLRVTIHRKNVGKKKHHLRILMITNDPVQPKVEINVKR
ncbi:DUF1573 domain-containing protein [Oscillospiraceae bacterium N12]|jgi:hypothetical protein|uniref:DUF1573 domain-containing protein n=1 Tax=Jilunia laotingensis TaxID=2763675 RepID=A0A926F2V2_9BACT|nr:DUF1573 domain-containing protein [Jilunia laotingensis]MBC8592371.1 DUF1573 domain-containing protein [Jilunia laotingensis]